ncbi:MAG: hypothetical protein NT169_24115 [Chloroflexi bacterium]|nr:hypothetical protein [Chloroflexota bacterium]
MVEYIDPPPVTMWFDPTRVKPVTGSLADKWMKQGWREGILEVIEQALDVKFGADGLRLLPEIQQIKAAKQLKAVRRAIQVAHTPEDIRRVYQRCAA